ncbi:DEAD-box ATP-dependent RNA helicase 53-like protein [Tanacetum coccineum]
MNTLFLLRASSKRLTNLASVTTTLKHLVIPSTSQNLLPNENNNNNNNNNKAGFGGGYLRNFHGSRWVSFRSTDNKPYAAGFAVASSPSYDISNNDNDTGLEISKLGISQGIVEALAKKGITKLFPIQRAVLEPAMQGRDMIGRARTGTGKTLAFGIPILDKIIQYNKKHGCGTLRLRGRNPLAIVMAPTRELARQVEKEFYESAPELDTLCVYGGSPIQRQMSTLDRGVDLDQIAFMLCFADDVEGNLGILYRNSVQNHEVGDSDQKLADGITLYSISSEMRERPSLIGPLITEHANGGKCIVFTQTKRDADRLAYALQKSFRSTDVAARGLDVPNVDLIIHYELQNSSEIFVSSVWAYWSCWKEGSAVLNVLLPAVEDVKGYEREVGCKFSELPPIAVDPASRIEMGGGFGSSGGRFGDSGFGGSGGRSGGVGSCGGGFGEDAVCSKADLKLYQEEVANVDLSVS